MRFTDMPPNECEGAQPFLTRGTRGLVDLGLSRPKRSVDKHNRSNDILWDYLVFTVFQSA